MSGKYHQLKKLSSELPVPPLTAITEQDLSVLWENYSAIRKAIERILTTIDLTSSAFLDEHMSELARLVRPQWHPEARKLLSARLGEVGLGFENIFAVRSSCSEEDALNHSYAGVFTTCLDVQGAPALQQAIEDVWSSNFGRAALMERLRHGTLSHLGEMTIILQRMVHATWAGISFSHDPISHEPTCIVEAVSGCGDTLVSGERRGTRAQIDGSQITPRLDANLNALFLDVAKLVQQVVAAKNGQAMDIEWAYDGKQLWLLQARPITTVRNTHGIDTPVFKTVPLYASSNAEIEDFKPLPDFAQYFRSKRKPMADFASRLGLPAATSLLIRANRAGLNDDENCLELMCRYKQSQLLLDISPQVRQLVTAREQVIARLRELLGPVPEVFVLRDFVHGEGGLITRVIDPDEVFCEWSLEGLLALNRGTASTVTFVIDQYGDIQTKWDSPEIPVMTPAQRKLIFQATQQAQLEFGCVQLEWVSDGNQLYIIDYSVLNAFNIPPEENGTRVISVGYASGLPEVVNASLDIEQLSISACVSLTDIPSPTAIGSLIAHLYERIRAREEPVVIVSPRPYAALAPLIPFAAGFIFEQASTLCHLAILLREHGIPAIESSLLYQQALTSPTKYITLNSSILAPS